MIDSHCHVHRCKQDPKLLLDQAHQAQLTGLVQVATDVTTAKWGIELAHQEHAVSVYPSAGLYPSQAKGEWQAQVPELQDLLAGKEVYAVGEAGIDMFHETHYLEEQQKMLRAQIELAINSDLPMIIHCRNSFDEIVETFSDFRGESKFRGVWHCFDGSETQAEIMMGFGFYISLSGLVTFNNCKKLQEVTRSLPKNRVMIETDSPYLSPIPKRGQPNVPAHVTHVCDFLSELWGDERNELESTFTKNTIDLFGLPRDPHLK